MDKIQIHSSHTDDDDHDFVILKLSSKSSLQNGFDLSISVVDVIKLFLEEIWKI